MGTIIYTSSSPEYFWDLFSESYDFGIVASKDGKSVTLTFYGHQAGGTSKLVLSGTSLTIKDGLITGGTITGIDAFNDAGKVIYDVSGLSIKGYLFRTDRLYDSKGLVLSGNDTITGSSKSNDIETGAGNDTVKAGAGDDFIKDFLGADTYDGGSGWDQVDFSDGFQHGWTPGKGINVNMVTGVVTDAWGYKDKLISIEGVRGTNYVDKFLGSNRDE
jgi:serralysin